MFNPLDVTDITPNKGKNMKYQGISRNTGGVSMPGHTLPHPRDIATQPQEYKELENFSH